jgi:hypothetical protein
LLIVPEMADRMRSKRSSTSARLLSSPFPNNLSKKPIVYAVREKFWSNEIAA